MPPRARPAPAPAPAPLPLTTLAGVAQVAGRHDAADVLFPAVPGATVDDQLRALQVAYRRIAAIVHPDQNPREVAAATSVLTHVNVLRGQREAEIRERGAPGLPPRGGFTARSAQDRRAGTGSIVRATHQVPVVYDDGYDDAEPPPLPACACVEVARATLPGRVVFCERAGRDWAVRTSDQRAIVVEHTAECSRYRWANPQATIEHGIVMHGSMFSTHSPGWCWAHARLVRQPVVDHFARRG
jgi:hypothetical protein